MQRTLSRDNVFSTFSKYILTFGVYLNFFAHGLAYSIISLTLLTLQEQLGVEYTEVNYGVLLRSFTFCVGSLLGSAVYNFIDRRLGLIAFIIFDGLATLAVALNQTFWVYLLAMAILGIAAGAIDVGNTVTILYIWKEKSNPFMQGLHFAFSVAMVLAPYLVAPFLADVPHQTNRTLVNSSSYPQHAHNDLHLEEAFALELATFNASQNNPSYNVTRESFNVLQLAHWTDDDQQLYNSTMQLTSGMMLGLSPSLHLVIPFSVCTGVLLIAAVGQFILFFVINETSVIRPNEEEVVIAEECAKSKPEKKQSLILIGAGCLLLCFYNVSEMNSFIYAPNFVTFKGYSEASGAQLAKYMSTAYSICRLLSILIATRVPTLYMLYIHFVIIVIGNVILLFFSSSLIQMTIGLCIVGSGLSAVFAALYAFYEELMEVTNGICGAFMFASALAVSLTPIVEGQFLPRYPAVYNYINLAAIFICFNILIYIHISHKNRRSQ